MRKTRLLIALMLCLIFAAVFSAGSVVGQDKTKLTNVVIAEDSHSSDGWILISEGDKIDVSVDVTSPSGGLIDVYIISSNQIGNYPDDTFTPAEARERVSSVDFTFTVPDDQWYYLVIDNTDNSRPNDAVPVGSVTVNYEYTNPWIDEVEGAFWTGMMLCIVGLVIIVVVIVVVIVLVLKSGKKTPPAQPQQPYQQQPYQQQPYQQPYQPPPGQQPPYQPPPGGQPPPQ